MAQDPPPLREADIQWRDAIPVATRFDDPYYSTDDPVGEVRHTFLDGVDSAEIFRKPRPVIAETGFGTGLNFLEAWAAFERLAAPDARLTFLSLEAYPLTLPDLSRAHAAFPEHEIRARALRAAWPGAIPGVHRIELGGGRIRLILLIGEAAAVLARQSFHADAWFLDGFAPARNPEMWRPEVLHEVARLSKPGTRLASFTAVGEVRRRLASVGFEVTRRPGFGRKRHCIAARMIHPPEVPAALPWTQLPPPLPASARIAVIGDGIAGRAVACALRADGRDVTHIGGDASTAYAASTLPRALIAPKLVRGDQPFPVFWRQAFWDAVRVLDAADCWQGPRGLLIPAGTPDLEAKQAALVANLGWPETDIRQIDAVRAEALLGRAMDGGLHVAAAGSIDPVRLRDFLSPAPDLRCDIADLRQAQYGWDLLDRQGGRIWSGDAVVVAAGPGSTPLLGPIAELRFAAGRLARIEAPSGAGIAVMRDGYLTARDPDGTINAGATAESWAPLAPVPADPDKDAALFRRIETLLPGARPDTATIWRGLRCDTVDHLPIIGPVPDRDAFLRDYDGVRHGKRGTAMPAATYRPGLFALTGLGARGFQGAFLAADTITAQLSDMPRALDQAVEQAIAPARFPIRALRKA